MLSCAMLPDRGILRLGGRDRFNFLQGLVSNDVQKLTKQKAIYALLLSPQGKFQYDFFIISVGEELWLDVNRVRLDDLKKRLSLFKLKSDVTLDIDLNQTISCCWGNDKLHDGRVNVDPVNFSSSPDLTVFQDPRLPDLGIRVIQSTKNSPVLSREDVSVVSLEDYQSLCLRLGVPRDLDLPIDRAIPLECGMDELHAIDWDKGCYMGQELTARTRYRGLVRKRLIPCRYQGELKEKTVLQGEQEVGEIRSFNHAWVMVLLRVESLKKSESLRCGTAILTPEVPYWMDLPIIES